MDPISHKTVKLPFKYDTHPIEHYMNFQNQSLLKDCYGFPLPNKPQEDLLTDDSSLHKKVEIIDKTLRLIADQIKKTSNNPKVVDDLKGDVKILEGMYAVLINKLVDF